MGVIRDITDLKRAAEEQERLVTELKTALAEVQTLRQILPICSYCRKVRDDENYWTQIESYITKHTGSMFTHGVCPTCYDQVLKPQLDSFRAEPP